MILWGKGLEPVGQEMWICAVAQSCVVPRKFLPFPASPVQVQVSFRVGVLCGHFELWVAAVIGQGQGRNVLHDAPSRVGMHTGSLDVLECFIKSTGFL